MTKDQMMKNARAALNDGRTAAEVAIDGAVEKLAKGHTLNHSAGPFDVDAGESREDGARILDRHGQHIATVCDIGYPEREEANATLVAAAPELLEALQYYVNLHRRNLHAMPEANENEGKEWRRTLGFADAAIAKATN